MVYELSINKTKEGFTEGCWDTYIAWETNRKNAISPCGKLLYYLDDSRKISIPDGIEVIGSQAFFRSDWDVFDLPVTELTIPSSVKKIEEGAFVCTEIEKIRIARGSSCGFIKNNALYSGDGKTLLWILGEEALKTERSKENPNREISVFTVPKGVERIAVGFCGYLNFDVLQLPESVNSIGNLYADGCEEIPVIRAPKGSEAISIAKNRGYEYEEI